MVSAKSLSTRGRGPGRCCAPGFVPTDQLVATLATSDVGLVALKQDGFRDLTLAGKMFDYIAIVGTYLQGITPDAIRSRAVHRVVLATTFTDVDEARR